MQPTDPSIYDIGTMQERDDQLMEEAAQAILDDFTIEDPMTHETLRRYIEKYPHLAERLCDVFHECQMADLKAAADSK